MNKYVVLYHAPAEAMAQMEHATPEQKQEGMKPWLAWKESMGNSLVDFGAPLLGGRRLLPDGNSESSTKEVSGYSIIQANSLEEAQALLQGHPHLSWTGGCDVEVHECASM